MVSSSLAVPPLGSEAVQEVKLNWVELVGYRSRRLGGRLRDINLGEN